MTAVATTQRRSLCEESDAYSPFDDGVTLEDRILGVWEALVVEGRAACPVCGGSMAPATGCTGCGSELS